ncbi:MAG: hypothetical protein ACTSRS_01110 [Candidatus Helarchaeota archaeon]
MRLSRPRPVCEYPPAGIGRAPARRIPARRTGIPASSLGPPEFPEAGQGLGPKNQ